MATEFWISHVEHETKTNGSRGSIARVCAWKYDGAARQLTDKKSYTRAQVVDMLGTSVLYTTTRDAMNSTWVRGAEVVLTRDGKYITTTPTDTTQDNLGRLPPCDC